MTPTKRTAEIYFNILRTTVMGDLRLISLAVIPPAIVILHLGEAKHHTLGRHPGWMTCRAADARQIAAWGGLCDDTQDPRLDETRTQPSGSALVCWCLRTRVTFLEGS